MFYWIFNYPHLLFPFKTSLKILKRNENFPFIMNYGTMEQFWQGFKFQPTLFTFNGKKMAQEREKMGLKSLAR